ncbi:dihydroxyacetone kinase subunit DhaL [Streptomyces sp. NPDC058664]|uniref:dihydroxyacetone kinase subunit DhaL n=1 Tax=unclassified Streptomyces TaxID=2593676 RepID=UPI003651A100
MLARDWLRAFARAAHDNKGRLTVLDSAIGDGDHGVNLCRGLSDVCRWLEEDDAPDSAGDVLSGAGALLLSRVGGASGVLYGSAFQAMGGELATPGADPRRLGAALDAGLAVIVKLGAAAPGDKTMVDAFVPALTAFRGSCDEAGCLRRATSAAASAARAGAESTIPLLARKGRASYLGHRSIGYLDPGAVSTELLFRTLAEVTSSVRVCA